MADKKVAATSCKEAIQKWVRGATPRACTHGCARCIGSQGVQWEVESKKPEMAGVKMSDVKKVALMAQLPSIQKMDNALHVLEGCECVKRHRRRLWTNA